MRGLLACGLAAVGLFAAYALLGAVGALTGGWSTVTATDQALGLAVHAAIVFARGLLPSVLLTLALQALARRRLGQMPGGLVTLAMAAIATAIAVPLLLTSKLGTWPHLQIDGAANAVATVALLALGSGAAVVAATRLTGSPRA